MAELCETYRASVFAFLRGWGLTQEEAQEHTQGFFASLLERDFIAKIDLQKEGQFRSWLRTAAMHHFYNELAQTRAKKRGGGITHVNVDGDDGMQLPDQNQLDAEGQFNRAWAHTIVERALRRLNADYAGSKHTTLVQQLLDQEETNLTDAELACGLGVSEGALRKRRHDLKEKVRRNFARYLRSEIADTLVRPADIEAEYQALIGPAAINPAPPEDPTEDPAASRLNSSQLGDLIKAGRVRTPSVGDWFGSYELVEEIGRGGMGIVFKAVLADVGEVAIKFMLDGEIARDADIRNFLAEAKRQFGLRHPNVVPVFHVACTDGQYYFTMPRYKRSLADSLRADLLTTTDWRSRVELLVKVALGVQYAHEHGLIHRDLKPGNILLDEKSEPHVADFGLAKLLDEDGVVGGTPGYMAPEQADSADVTKAVDIYALGVILFELLTGQSPFRSDLAVAVIEQVRNPAPAPLRSVKPTPEPLRSVEPAQAADLERICARCLAKNPLERYPTARALALDLECVLAKRAITIPPSAQLGRAVHWLRRRPKLARSLVFVPAVLLAVAVGSYWIWQTLTHLREAEQYTNAQIAKGKADAALLQLKEFEDRLESAAGDPSIIRLAHATSYVEKPGKALELLADGFDAAFVLDKMGLIRAQWPDPPRNIRNKSYAFRDYFQALQGSKESGRAYAYVAPALLSERDGELKFALSVPLFDQGKVVGVLVALVATDSAFGSIGPQEQDDRVIALLGPRDMDRDEEKQPPRERIVVLIHEGLKRGQEVRLPNHPKLLSLVRQRAPWPGQLTLVFASPERDEAYVDPVSGFAGRWQAAFASVGRTGFVISVQTPRRDAWDAVKQWASSSP
jgi:serine/threonine protein kinase/DNA-directed RNA polymerase specialized sigma24 family protein